MTTVLKGFRIDLTLSFNATDPMIAKLNAGIQSAGIQNMDILLEPQKIDIEYSHTNPDTRVLKIKAEFAAGFKEIVIQSAGISSCAVSALNEDGMSRVFLKNGVPIRDGLAITPETAETAQSAKNTVVFFQDFGRNLVEQHLSRH